MTRTLDLDFAITHGPFDLQVRAAIELDGITAVFGPSGAGKTTLLRAIAGLDRPARGRIECDGVVWHDSTRNVAAHLRRVGYVFQDGRLFPHLSVEQNLRFAAEHSRAPRPIGMRDAVAALELQDLLDRRPASLSGGEQQRVAIGRALLTNPRLLLMDEPLSSLDSGRRREIAAFIEQLPARFDLAVLYVTHDIDEVIRLAGRMLLLARGRVAAQGSIKEILDRIDLWPLTGRLEAGSILEAVVDAHVNGMSHLKIEGQTLRIPAIEAAAGKMIRLRIHARDVVIAMEQPTRLSIRNVLEGRLSRIDLDDTVYAELLLDIGTQSLRARITREALAELDLVTGQTLYALVKSVAFDDALLR
jgi:molybdate transport system ATP-binding protein